ncbi:MAG TPA: hypothetical protein VEO01_25040 [Pseudonocardiaceae bacterium]|nr:hypothetical protein [Pseudonocardiaceae bacterium]
MSAKLSALADMIRAMEHDCFARRESALAMQLFKIRQSLLTFAQELEEVNR